MDNLVYVEMGGLFKMDKLKVISLDELRGLNTEVIPLSSKTGSGQIGVEVKRLSILGMCKNGTIPNPLLGVAKQLFYNDRVETLNLKEYGEILDIISKEVLVNPTYEQFEELAPLTDDQKFELYIYSQKGLEGLERFRSLSKNVDSTNLSEQVQNKAQSDTES